MEYNKRLQALFAMLEEHLRRPLAPEERRLIALTEPWSRPGSEDDPSSLAEAAGGTSD